MRAIKTSTGVEIPLDGDLLAVVETLFQEVTVRHELARTFEDMMREIQHLADQLSPEELRAYFIESLFLNTVTYENETPRRAAQEAAGRRVGKPAFVIRPSAFARRGVTVVKASSVHVRSAFIDVREPSRHPVHVLLAMQHRGAAL